MQHNYSKKKCNVTINLMLMPAVLYQGKTEATNLNKPFNQGDKK